ncbi:MAG TPA: hypothetical protein VG323_19075 [Thermoanaerobaculia bacterium]|nr:hypothetical protein [Thermoanaerobaculia bacterium]
MAEPKEPQSYGSQGDWVSGDVDQEVNRLKGRPNSQHGDFYDQGGKVSPEQIEENVQPGDACERDGEAPPRNVSTQPGGAKRDSYFRKRDYPA